jgi:hypothetical protein
MSLEELDRLFEDPANRPLGTFYYCAEDPRIIAPSRPNWKGFQINFAHPGAVPFLLFYLSVLIGPLLSLHSLGHRIRFFSRHSLVACFSHQWRFLFDYPDAFQEYTQPDKTGQPAPISAFQSIHGTIWRRTLPPAS